MKTIPVRIILLIVAAFFPLTVMAQGNQSPFNSSELNSFLSDFPEVVLYLEERGQLFEQNADADRWESGNAGAEFRDFLEAKGWDPERFGYVSSHVAQGLAVLEMQRRAPDMQAQLEEARQAIMNEPNLSADMKKQMLEQLDQSMAQSQGLEQAGNELPASEMTLIEANQERIRQAFEVE